MEYILIGIAIAIGLWIAPVVIGLVVMSIVFIGSIIVSILKAIFGGNGRW